MTRFEKQQLEKTNSQLIEKFFQDVPGPRYSFHSYNPANPSTADSNFILDTEPAHNQSCAIALLAGGWINKVSITTINQLTRLEIASYHPKNLSTCVQLVLVRHECAADLTDQADCGYCDHLYWLGAQQAEMAYYG